MGMEKLIMKVLDVICFILRICIRFKFSIVKYFYNMYIWSLCEVGIKIMFWFLCEIYVVIYICIYICNWFYGCSVLEENELFKKKGFFYVRVKNLVFEL